MAHLWYILHVQSGFEKKISQSIREQSRKENLEHEILEVIIPTEKIVEVRRGLKVNAERKIFPGYILLKMELTNKSWHIVKKIPKVSDFLGSRGKPTPIPNKDAQRILKQIQEGISKPKPMFSFEIGEEVLVSDGPFASFNGVVEEIDEERSRLKVSVSIFGRSTPVELEYSQVEKT
jgi:transcriptional antiterminator NusG